MVVDLNEVYSKFSSVPWIRYRTILLCKHGSHAYGMATPASDLDIKGVAVPPARYFMGFVDNFEQAESREPYDLVVFDIRKFMKLAADGNPNIMEILWADDSDRILISKSGEELVACRDLFLSKKVKHTFSGYAISQLKRINTHRRWLINPPTHVPTRAEFGLSEQPSLSKDQLRAAESEIEKQLDSWDVDLECLDEVGRIALKSRIGQVLSQMKITDETSRFQLAGKKLGFDENFLVNLEKERKYRGAMREWAQFNNWKETRNQQRAELEAKHGYDTKHGAHLVRLMRMCREILETGKVLVKRPDAQELLEIRGGAWSYDRLIEWAAKEDSSLEEAAKSSKLPHSPDRKQLSEICMQIVESMLHVDER